MKFLCDRCKTRYSIGDDRVRGKILKIRCKNCANVITVREGMPDADAAIAADPASRNPKKTTGAPAATAALDAPPSMAARNGGAGASGALGAAFASAMTKPPPALEEEWYVSIDGEQAGPFTLAEAQRWVAGKSYDAELHCWSEGFDDWLPVDKVSHFRGLRKKPAPPPMPAAPPPLPRVSPTGPARALHQHAPIDESEPKPLFAATMASLEKAQPVQPLGMAPAPAAMGPATARPSATPPKGVPMQARTNGNAAPLPAARNTPVPPADPRTGKSGGVPTTTLRGAGAPAKPAALGFDASELGESKTQLEAAAFDDEPATTAEPVAARRLAPMPAAAKAPSGPIATARDGFATKPLPAHQNAPLAARDAFASTLSESDAGATVPNAPASKPPVDDDDDRLDIGEVSRVVKLADIARTPRTQPIARRTGAIPAAQVGRATAGVPRISTRDLGNAPTVPLDALNAPAPGMQPAEGEAPQLQPAVVASHRRALIALIIGAVALLGAAIVVVFLVMEDDDAPTKGLGRDYVQDDTRPEAQIAKIGSNGSAGALPGSGAEPVNPFVPKRPYKPPPQHIDPPIPPVPTPGDSLKTDEIEAMAKQYNTNFQICFRRADRGVGSIVLQDIKRILVSFTLNKDGTVASVTLSDNQIPELTSCLSRTVQGWKFRPGPTKSYGFTLVPPR